ncbi:MAG: aminotransferase class I/II-fold pyridoxal phosphate-dependent enzyme [Mogibacterium sp.]|nr:aminotransferase class I/II-fold pyridoxal phosphate-dependent enzyme [Mogibacterium sp.]
MIMNKGTGCGGSEAKQVSGSCSGIVHGGDIYRNDVTLDFSVNLNPEPAPEEIMTAALRGLELMHNYPDPLQEELRTTIGEMAGASAEDIVCGCGASELMMATVHAVQPKKALIAAPCYAGYGYALRASGADVTEYALREEKDFALDAGFADCITGDTDIVFIANPNNPNGRLIEPEVLNGIKRKCAETGTVLVIDECFLQLTERYAEQPDTSDGAVHLRAFTKTFAIPGIRMGYMVCGDRELTAEVRKHLPEWNISAIAERIGTAAAKVISGTGYLEKSNAAIARERSYLEKGLRELGIRVYPSDTNYLLLRQEEWLHDRVPGSGSGLYDRLLEKGILVRRCANYHGLDESYFRIAVRRHEDNEKLLAALEEILR